jgi:hypothetical protein
VQACQTAKVARKRAWGHQRLLVGRIARQHAERNRSHTRLAKLIAHKRARRMPGGSSRGRGPGCARSSARAFPARGPLPSAPPTLPVRTRRRPPAARRRLARPARLAPASGALSGPHWACRRGPGPATGLQAGPNPPHPHPFSTAFRVRPAVRCPLCRALRRASLPECRPSACAPKSLPPPPCRASAPGILPSLLNPLSTSFPASKFVLGSESGPPSVIGRSYVLRRPAVRCAVRRVVPVCRPSACAHESLPAPPPHCRASAPPSRMRSNAMGVRLGAAAAAGRGR